MKDDANIFKVTEKLRNALATAQQQHDHTKVRAREGGLGTLDYVTLGMAVEFRRGRADGIRYAIDIISKGMRGEL